MKDLKYVRLAAFFIALIGNIIYQNNEYGCLQYASFSFLFASFVYVSVGFFAYFYRYASIVLSLVLTAVVLWGIAWVEDTIMAHFSFLNTEIMLWVFTIISCFFVIGDIIMVIVENKLKKELIKETLEEE